VSISIQSIDFNPPETHADADAVQSLVARRASRALVTVRSSVAPLENDRGRPKSLLTRFARVLPAFATALIFLVASARPLLSLINLCEIL